MRRSPAPALGFVPALLGAIIVGFKGNELQKLWKAVDFLSISVSVLLFAWVLR